MIGPIVTAMLKARAELEALVADNINPLQGNDPLPGIYYRVEAYPSNAKGSQRINQFTVGTLSMSGNYDEAWQIAQEGQKAMEQYQATFAGTEVRMSRMVSMKDNYEFAIEGYAVETIFEIKLV